MKQEDQSDFTLSQVASELRSWGGVAVVGAGLSVFSGMPLVRGLDSLVWHALDLDPDAFQDLANRLGRTAVSGKALVGDNATRLSHAYCTIRRHPRARSVFQHGFVKRNSERIAQPSQAHESLATLFHANHIELVISLNWDTLFEAAYERLYGRWVSVDNALFFKPHGDAAFPDQPWILPGEDGRLPDQLVQSLTAFAADRPRLLLIAGYSESDEAVVRELIEPLSQHWRVARIGPDASGEFSIPLPADQALPRLLHLVDPRPAHSPWAAVRFSQQHDLGPALSGEGLGPADIAALPALPEADIAAERMKTAYRAIISGEAGCGKSGVAYRAAQTFHKIGYEVLRLAAPVFTVRDLISPLEGLRFSTLAIVDDAHRLPPYFLNELLNKAGPRLLILGIMTTAEPAGRDEIRIDAKRAVSIIAAALRKNRAETLAFVQKLDSHVGDRYLDDSLERRIEHAAEQPFPWQFAFVLTGGWKRVGQHIVSARAASRADVLLFAVAVHQLVTLDDAPGSNELAFVAHAFGFDSVWITASLRVLAELRLITSSESPKCPHLRHAVVIIQTILKDNTDPLRTATLAYLDAVLSKSDLPLRGVYWLIDALRFADGLRGIRNTILSHTTRTLLITRSFEAKDSLDRGTAGYLLSLLDDFIPDWDSVLDKRIAGISTMISESDGISGWGLARLLNDIDRDHHMIVNAALSAVDVISFAKKLESTPFEQLAGMSELLDRLAYVGRDGFASALRAKWSPTSIAALARAAAHDAYTFGKVINAICHFDVDLALRLIDENIAAMARAFAQHPLETFEALHDVLWFVLSFDMGLGITRAPRPLQRQLAKRLCKNINAADCARSIENGRLGDLERWARFLFFVKRADPNRAQKIIAEVSLDQLDVWLTPFWVKPPTDLEHFVLMLALKPHWEPSRSWIERHKAELREIPLRFAIIAPEACASAMHNGARLDYPKALGLHWQELTGALACLAKVNHDIAEQSLRKEVDALARSLTTHQANLYEKSDTFLDLAESIAPGITQAIFDLIDPQLAAKHWPQVFKGKPAQRRAVKKLLDIAATYEAPLTETVRTLRTQRARRSMAKRLRS